MQLHWRQPRGAGSPPGPRKLKSPDKSPVPSAVTHTVSSLHTTESKQHANQECSFQIESGAVKSDPQMKSTFELRGRKTAREPFTYLLRSGSNLVSRKAF
jgi:hypothetical protein